MIDDLYQRQRRQIVAQPLFQWPGLRGWNFYFVGKALLAIFGLIVLNPLYNIVFIASLAFPVKHSALKALRVVIAIPAAFALLYSETSLPPISRLLAQWEQVSAFSWRYLTELTMRFVSFDMIAILLVAWIAYLYLNRVLRMTVISIVLILGAGYWQVHGQPESPLKPQALTALNPVGGPQQAEEALDADNLLSDFYKTQGNLIVTPTSNVLANIDIVMVNICSLSWDDLDSFDLANHPFIQRNDIVFSNFNSGSSYSGPAALRLLRANCGQQPHAELFEPINSQCYLTESLAELGFASQLLMNHTGEFDNFTNLLEQHGGFAGLPTKAVTDVPTVMEGFDGTPIYSDRAILQQAIDTSSEQPSFTFYNTVSLHDGNQLSGNAQKLNSVQSYGLRAEQLLNDLDYFYDQIDDRERPVLVIIAPEHGSGLQGDSMQLPGVREIPTPSLTQVPVMISLRGQSVSKMNEQPIVVDESVGPTAISSVIYQIIERLQKSTTSSVPYSFNANRVVQDIPTQKFVAENDSVVVMERNLQLLLKIEQQDWIIYPNSEN